MHFINRKLLSTFARLLLAVMLFAQYSLATQACMLPEAAPAMVFMDEAMPDCHMHDMDEHNPNACFAHCTSDYQALDTHHAALDLPAVLLPTALAVSNQRGFIPAQTYLPAVLARVVGPPPYLLHQNFRI
ncbi:hypothetical protein [Sulfuriferula thiophila]|uniref:hypothetical protein n=1 Tax=Sulfuriferula thiophila TaxID=1781211 RepID=UPI000F60CBE0|nr:hypothetical protein [Sulfuriferula thiophila]